MVIWCDYCERAIEEVVSLPLEISERCERICAESKVRTRHPSAVLMVSGERKVQVVLRLGRRLPYFLLTSSLRRQSTRIRIRPIVRVDLCRREVLPLSANNRDSWTVDAKG